MTGEEERRVAVRFGDLIRQRRLARGESMTVVGRKIGVERQNYRRFERGEGLPRLDSVVRIARALEISPLELLAEALEGVE